MATGNSATAAARVVLALALLCSATSASAHGMRSAALEVFELEPGVAIVSLRASAPEAGLQLIVPDGCVATPAADQLVGELTDPPFVAAPSSPASVTVGLRCPDPLAGMVLGVDGLGPVITEAVIHATLHDGTLHADIVTRARPTSTLPVSIGHSVLSVVRRYLNLGWRHILAGADHVLFLLALTLLAPNLRSLLVAATSFTVAHSATLALTALELLRVRQDAAEACIALSLALAGLELARRGLQEHEFEDRRPTPSLPLLAFGFGLVHGLGFAGALGEIGLPANRLVSALVGFNLGVELGQVALVSTLLLAFRILPWRAAPRLLRPFLAYGIGSLGSFWFLERMSS